MPPPAAARKETKSDRQHQASTPAILFDLDGTLLDSNYEHVLAWRLALRHEGVEICPQFVRKISLA